MDARKRDVYARHLLELLQLSECGSPKAAIIIGRKGRIDITHTAVSRRIIPDKDYTTSPVLETVMHHGIDKIGVLFSSYFPSMEEFLLLSSTKIRTIRYMGDIENESTILFLNAYASAHVDDAFEIIKMQI